MTDSAEVSSSRPSCRSTVIGSHAAAAHRRSVPRNLLTVRTCTQRRNPPPVRVRRGVIVLYDQHLRTVPEHIQQRVPALDGAATTVRILALAS